MTAFDSTVPFSSTTGWGRPDDFSATGGIDPRRLRLRQGGTVRWTLWISGLLLTTAGAAWLWREVAPPNDADLPLIVAIPGTILGGTGLVMAVLIGLLTRSWTRRVLEMAGDEATVRWCDYPRQQWLAFLEAEATRTGNTLLGVVALFAIGGLVLAGISILYGDHAGLVASLATGGIGVIVCGLIWWFNTAGIRAMRRDGGLVLIGDDGIFISGTYWPWSAFGQTLIGVELKPADGVEFSQIALTFRVKTKHGSMTKDVHVPVPIGREVEAELVVNRLRRDVL